MNPRTYRSRVPLRLGLAGGGTDVSPFSDEYGGSVLNITISLYTYCTLTLTDGDRAAFFALDRNENEDLPTAYPLPIGQLFSLHKAVYNRIVRDYLGGRSFGFVLTTHSDAPAGSGLGTSSALVVSIVGAFVEAFRLPLGEYDIAHLAYEVERLDLGMAGGKQDQYSATFGGVNFMEFYAKDRVIVNPLKVKPQILNELQYNLLLFHTGASRQSAEIISNQIRSVENSDQKSIDSMLFLKEQARQMKESLLRGEVSDIGKLLNSGWEQKKKIATGITNPGLDHVYEAARKAGISGGKISGAGGGGFFIFFCDRQRRSAVVEALKPFNGWFVDFNFTMSGLESWEVFNG